MARALNAKEFLNKRFVVLPFEGQWLKTFGEPESNFSMIIYGKSGNGKTEFAVMFSKYITRFGKAIYNSFEQGFSKSLQDAWRRQGLEDVSNHLLLVHKEPFDEFVERLKRKKSPSTVVIDSLQYIRMTYQQWQYLRNTFPRKRFILIAHAEGDEPKGSAAKDIEFDVDIKVLIKGFQVIPKSRFGGNEPFVFYEKGHANFLMRQGKLPGRKKQASATPGQQVEIENPKSKVIAIEEHFKSSRSMIVITLHAQARAKERLGYKADTLKRLAAMAYCYGQQLCETKGKLRRFLNRRQEENPENDIRVYGEVLYIFTSPPTYLRSEERGNIRLVTVYQLPNDVKQKPKKNWAKFFIEDYNITKYAHKAQRPPSFAKAGIRIPNVQFRTMPNSSTGVEFITTALLLQNWLLCPVLL